MSTKLPRLGMEISRTFTSSCSSFPATKTVSLFQHSARKATKVNEVIQAWLDQGYRIDQVAVTLDNTVHIQFTSHHTGKVAHWLVSDADRLPLAELHSHQLIGVMDNEGLKAIATGVLNFASTSERFSAAVIKKLRQLAG